MTKLPEIVDRVPAGWRHIIRVLQSGVELTDAYENYRTGALEIRFNPRPIDDQKHVDWAIRLAGKTCIICGQKGQKSGRHVLCTDHENEVTKERILRNSAQCRNCGEEIESRHVHEFRCCRCGDICVDGGHAYIRRVMIDESWIDTSIVVPIVDQEPWFTTGMNWDDYDKR